MVIDISQFHDVFFEESFEGLDIMEAELLGLSEGMIDLERINTIFRAAHSLKGGAGTFGFMAISELTHILETMLNDMRSGEREVTTSVIKLLLESVDLLRVLLTSVKQKAPIDDHLCSEMKLRLTAVMSDDVDILTTSLVETNETIESPVSIVGWNIYFRPHSHLIQTGNDPVRMLRELASLGELTTELIDDKLPIFFDLEPENSYLAWQLTLKGNIAEEDVVEIFEWVDDDCDLNIEAITAEVEVTEPEPTELDTVETSSSLLDDLSDLEDDQVEPEPVTTKPVVTVSETNVENVVLETTGNSIRVGTEKVDSLINLVSELVITQSMLNQLGDDFTADMLPKLIDGLSQLERNTREMQESVMRMRMLPISFAFNRFPRLIHDLTDKAGKKVELKLTGEQTEVDKSIMEKIGDPLVHLVRNSLDHGIETPDVRLAAGKPETGLLELKAFHQGGKIVIEIHDDGAGLDEEKILAKAVDKKLINPTDTLSSEKIHELIFLPGFSTAEAVTELSGRGVGMDVVRKNITSLNGSVEVKSIKGEGTVFTIRLPLTLAIMDGQTIQVAKEKYILPLVSVIETIEINNDDIEHVTGKGELYGLRDEYIPIIRLYDVFNLVPQFTDLEEGLIVVVEGDGQKVGLFIDDLLGQQQVVIKSLEDNYRKVQGVAGATILGDGSVALILDVMGLLSLYREPLLVSNSEQAA